METASEEKKIELGAASLKYLNTTRKWTMFFAIIGFIFFGIMIIAGIAAGAFLSFFDSGTAGLNLPPWVLIPVILVITLLYFFPVLFLFRFSIHMRNAVQTLSSEELRKAFRSMKSYWVYIGVMVIIVLTFYFLALVIAGSSMSFLKSLS